MIKIFTMNKNGKIELSKEELQKLLDDSYWEGYRANSTIYTYHSPTVGSPWTITCNTASNTATANTIDLNTVTTSAATDKNLNVTL